MTTDRTIPPDLHALLMRCLSAGLEVVFRQRGVETSWAMVRIWREKACVDGAGVSYLDALEAAVYNARQAGWMGASRDE